jgi:hypothetical protein
MFLKIYIQKTYIHKNNYIVFLYKKKKNFSDGFNCHDYKQESIYFLSHLNISGVYIFLNLFSLMANYMLH